MKCETRLAREDAEAYYCPIPRTGAIEETNMVLATAASTYIHIGVKWKRPALLTWASS